jgi:hypothetical protein
MRQSRRVECSRARSRGATGLCLATEAAQVAVTVIARVVVFALPHPSVTVSLTV